MSGSKLLLDTCAIIWLMNGVELDEDAVFLIDNAAKAGQVFVSPVTAWEIALLSRKGKIATTMAAIEWYERVVDLPGIQELPLNASIMTASVELPGVSHRDPADRMLIATARSNDLTLVTRDQAILAYAEKGFVKALAC